MCNDIIILYCTNTYIYLVTKELIILLRTGINLIHVRSYLVHGLRTVPVLTY